MNCTVLGHTLGEFPPPSCSTSSLYRTSRTNFLSSVMACWRLSPFSRGQIHGLLPYLHLLVKAPLLGEVADAVDIVGDNRVVIEEHNAGIRHCNLVDDSDLEWSCLPRLAPEQTEDSSFRNFYGDMVQGRISPEHLDYVPTGYCVHTVVKYYSNLMETSSWVGSRRPFLS